MIAHWKWCKKHSTPHQITRKKINIVFSTSICLVNITSIIPYHRILFVIDKGSAVMQYSQAVPCLTFLIWWNMKLWSFHKNLFGESSKDYSHIDNTCMTHIHLYNHVMWILTKQKSYNWQTKWKRWTVLIICHRKDHVNLNKKDILYNTQNAVR